MALHFVAFPLWAVPPLCVSPPAGALPSPQPPYRVRGRLSPTTGEGVRGFTAEGAEDAEGVRWKSRLCGILGHFGAFPLWAVPVSLRRWGRPSPQPPYRVRGRLSPTTGEGVRGFTAEGDGGSQVEVLLFVAWRCILLHFRCGPCPLSVYLPRRADRGR